MLPEKASHFKSFNFIIAQLIKSCFITDKTISVAFLSSNRTVIVSFEACRKAESVKNTLAIVAHSQ